MLKVVFGFAKHQEKVTYGLGDKLTLTRNRDEAVSNKADAIAYARLKVDLKHWFIPHYTFSIPQQGILSKQILSKTPIELRYFERSVLMEKVNNQNLSNFALGSQESMDVTRWVIVGFLKRDTQDSQNQNNDSFYRLPVVKAQCVLGGDKYPDTGVIITYEDHEYSQGNTQFKGVFRASTKDDIFQRYITYLDFRPSNVRTDDIGYNLYVLYIRLLENFTVSQPIKV